MTNEELFILQQMIAGDEHALKYFFDTYYDDLCNFANTYLHDETLSEDIVQEIFIHFWENRASLQLISSVKAYLYTASKNRSLNQLRNQKNQHRIIDELADKADSTTLDSNRYLEAAELRQLIQKAIESLPPQCRRVYELSRDAALSHQEIASQLGISMKTVENQITIAIRKIREFLRPYYDKIFFLFFFTFFQ